MNEGGGEFRDESVGQPVFGEPQVASKLLEAPADFEGLIIQAGSAAELEGIMSRMRTMSLGIQYRSPTLTQSPLMWLLATRGSDGEANSMALQAAIGQLELAQGRGGRRPQRGKQQQSKSMAEQGAIETQVAS